MDFIINFGIERIRSGGECTGRFMQTEFSDLKNINYVLIYCQIGKEHKYDYGNH
jgi:hypothetical protein